MVYGCGNQLIKFLIFISNFLIFVLGGLIFGFSLWANLDQNFARHMGELVRQAKIDDGFVDDLAQYQASLWVLVAVGALLLVVGFLGCCGAACESLICLTLFFVIVMVLAVIELFTLVFLFSNRGELLSSVHQVFVKSSETPEGRSQLLPIEKLLNCCGATIETAHFYKQQGLCAGDLQNANDCYSVLSDQLESMGQHLVIIGVLLLIVQAFSMIFSCVLCRAFRENGPAYYA